MGAGRTIYIVILRLIIIELINYEVKIENSNSQIYQKKRKRAEHRFLHIKSYAH